MIKGRAGASRSLFSIIKIPSARWLRTQTSAATDANAKDELRAELRRLIDGLRKNAGSAQAYNLVAWYDATHDDPERGLIFAHKAIVADSSCFECYDTAAIALHQLGKLKEALAAERMGVQLIPDGEEDPAMVNRLRLFERKSAEAAPR